MGNYLYGETPSTIYKELLGIGGTADRAGLTSQLHLEPMLYGWNQATSCVSGMMLYIYTAVAIQ